MARSPAILVDPTGQQLLAALQTAVRCEYDEQGHDAPTRLPDPAPLLAEPPAVWLHFLADHRHGTPKTAVLVTHWTDPLGDHLWLIECLYEHSYNRYDQTRRTVGQWHETYQHPLQRIAPPDRFVLREFAGTAAHPIVLCRCGAVGSPEELAWRGSQCGPCHDREQDGEPPVGPFLPAVLQTVLLADEDGWIVEQDGTVESLDPEGRVRWRRPGEGLDAHGGTRDLLLWARHREVCCVEGHTGKVFKRWITREPIQDVRVLNDHTLVTVHASHLEWWYAGFTEPHRTTRFSGQASGRLTGDPSGETLLLPTDEGILSFSRHGHRIATLVSWESSLRDYVVALSPTEVLALRLGIYRTHLHIWDLSAESASPELTPRRSYPIQGQPRLLRSFDSPPVPMLAYRVALQRLDPDTLTPLITLTFPGRDAPELTPVGPDLVLLHGTQENLLVPWRDLFGPEATPSS